MSFDATTDFTPYKVNSLAVKLAGDPAAETIGCTGKLEREVETTTIEKKCGNVTLATRTMPTGKATVTVSVFCKHEIAVKLKSMVTTGFKAGVYGQSLNAFPEFCLCADVEDFDGVHQYHAYPKATLSSYPKLTVDNAQDGIDAVEFEIATSADANNMAFYEAIATDLDSDTATKWMTAFSADLIKATA